MGSLSSTTPRSWSRKAESTYSGWVNVDSASAHSSLASSSCRPHLVALGIAIGHERRAGRQDRVVGCLGDREPRVGAAEQRVLRGDALHADGVGAVSGGHDSVRVDEGAGAVEPAPRVVEAGVDRVRDVEQQLADVGVLAGIRRSADDGPGRCARGDQRRCQRRRSHSHGKGFSCSVPSESSSRAIVRCGRRYPGAPGCTPGLGPWQLIALRLGGRASWLASWALISTRSPSMPTTLACSRTSGAASWAARRTTAPTALRSCRAMTPGSGSGSCRPRRRRPARTRCTST